MLKIKNLRAHIEDNGKKEILKGLNLELEKGKVYAIMGPNGSGKSTLANVLMGSPKYIVDDGEILYEGENVLEMAVDARAKKGIFLSFQYPQEIEGVTISSFLRSALNSVGKKMSILEFNKFLEEKIKELKVDEEFVGRYLNKGFSGGEKKKSEILQLLVLNPSLAILDETDSGLDIDALRIISEGINKFKNENKTILVITHYKRILEQIKPDKVFVMKNGQIVEEGGEEIIDKLEKEGYGEL